MNALLRKVFLALSRNHVLRQRLPRLPFMRRAVGRFMPGETAEDALRAASALGRTGIASEFTRLGENVTQPGEAAAVAEHYLDLFGRIRDAGLDGEISVKPTQLGLDIDEEATFAHLDRLATRAEETGSFLWLDMEDSTYVERTLALYERLHATHARTGICLQAYLRRTAADLERLMPLGPAVRLVKGAYDEPTGVAVGSKREVDTSFVALAVTALRAGRDGGLRLGLGTHDTALVEQIAGHAAAAGIARDAFEVQMLYGIRASEQRRLAAAGYRVRCLIAYGEAWYAWYMRRLAERPANVVFAIRQLLP
ncbi:MAG: proline dehydrogenase family protein [Chloroflexota bacterium]